MKILCITQGMLTSNADWRLGLCCSFRVVKKWFSFSSWNTALTWWQALALSVSVICRLVSPWTKRCLSLFRKPDLQVLDEIIEALSGFLWSGSELPIVNPSGETRAARFATYLTLLASAHLIISKFALHPSNKIRELHNWRLRSSFFPGKFGLNSRCRAHPDANVSGGSKTVEWLWWLSISTDFFSTKGSHRNELKFGIRIWIIFF